MYKRFRWLTFISAVAFYNTAATAAEDTHKFTCSFEATAAVTFSYGTVPTGDELAVEISYVAFGSIDRVAHNGYALYGVESTGLFSELASYNVQEGVISITHATEGALTGNLSIFELHDRNAAGDNARVWIEGA